MLVRAVVALSALLSVATAALADPQYVDDRSTPVAVIQSFYDAIDRQEYARAYSYYEDGQGVAKFEDFQAGYADTASVSIAFGSPTSEGAAGSTFYSLPVSIGAISTSGKPSYFAGCYTLRLANPAIQAAPPFQPMHIVSGHLVAAKGVGQKYLPKSCAQ